MANEEGINYHFQQCCEDLANYGAELSEKVRQGKLNVSAVEGLAKSYLSQPAFYNYNGVLHAELMWQVMKYVDCKWPRPGNK